MAGPRRHRSLIALAAWPSHRHEQLEWMAGSGGAKAAAHTNNLTDGPGIRAKSKPLVLMHDETQEPLQGRQRREGSVGRVGFWLRDTWRHMSGNWTERDGGTREVHAWNKGAARPQMEKHVRHDVGGARDMLAEAPLKRAWGPGCGGGCSEFRRVGGVGMADLPGSLVYCAPCKVRARPAFPSLPYSAGAA